MNIDEKSDSFHLHLIRHPQTDWNAERRYQGLSDRPWSPAGTARAKQIVGKFTHSPFDHVISSPRKHSQRLASQLSDNVHENHCWAEIDHGKWEGLTYQEVRQYFPNTVDERFANPRKSKSHGGQNLDELKQQIDESWREILSQNQYQNIVIITHATPIQMILCAITGLAVENYWQFRIDCGSITSLDITPAGCIINFCNQI